MHGAAVSGQHGGRQQRWRLGRGQEMAARRININKRKVQERIPDSCLNLPQFFCARNAWRRGPNAGSRTELLEDESLAATSTSQRRMHPSAAPVNTAGGALVAAAERMRCAGVSGGHSVVNCCENMAQSVTRRGGASESEAYCKRARSSARGLNVRKQKGESRSDATTGRSHRPVGTLLTRPKT